MLINLFKKKNVQKVFLPGVVASLQRKCYDASIMPNSNIVLVKSKYVNNHKTFEKLYLHFIDGYVQFKDQRGNKISFIPEFVSLSEMYSQLMNVLNVVAA